MKHTVPPTTLADRILAMASHLARHNASDTNISQLKAMAEEVRKLEEDPGSMLSFVAGWRASRDEQNKDCTPYDVYAEWMKVFDLDAQMAKLGKTMGAAAMCHKDDVEPDNFQIPISPELAQGFGSLGHVDLFDPDTKERLEAVPVAEGAKFQARAFNPGHTADMVLMDRVAKLENEVMRIKRDMGERIRELSDGTTFEGRIR